MLESGPLDAKVLSVFDFDGTLTHHDSFVPFLKFAFAQDGEAGGAWRAVSVARD
jgi:FMN phosphatase YigB (HAD superfamily)